jgi:hypothetical protein
MRAKVALAIGATAALLAGPASSAEAATVTIGSPLTGTYSPGSAGVVGTFGMVAGPNIASPVDGTVVSWQIKGFGGGPYRLQILQVATLTSASSVRTGPAFSPVPSGSQGTVSLPIEKGQVVALQNSNASDQISSNTTAASFGAAWVPPLADGGPASTAFIGGAIEYPYNTTVRYCVVPSLRGRKLGAAKKALAAADCTVGRVKKKGKGKKSKFVRSQGVAPGTSVSDTAPLDLKVGKKPKKS